MMNVNDKNKLPLMCSDAIDVAANVLNIDIDEIKNITVMKCGMTNDSFTFVAKGQKYIMRIPGAGTQVLIDRKKEYEVYSNINGLGLCDDVIYINPYNGYKISKFLDNSRVCNPLDISDLRLCMSKLRYFHNLKIKVNHEFDIFEQIEYYESLRNNKNSIYDDYYDIKNQIYELREYIRENVGEKVLSHIDAVSDNFLFCNSGEVRIIDWEYSGMQDPHVDIAMFCIYSLYDREQIDNIIDIYFEGNCPKNIRVKIYCYIATCGLLWSNWCEYKKNVGVEFGEYALKQYEYAKEYYLIAKKEMQ